MIPHTTISTWETIHTHTHLGVDIVHKIELQSQIGPHQAVDRGRVEGLP